MAGAGNDEARQTHVHALREGEKLPRPWNAHGGQAERNPQHAISRPATVERRSEGGTREGGAAVAVSFFLLLLR